MTLKIVMKTANIWSLKKHDSIKHLLLLLSDELGEEAFELSNDMLSDKAVYLQHPLNPESRVYIFTVGQCQERYGAHLEYPANKERASFIDAYEDLSISALSNLLTIHFDKTTND